MTDYRTRNPDKFRAIDLKRVYGLSIERYFEMVKDQDGKCKMCARAMPTNSKRPLAVDHNHKTGEVRGLLCYRCNGAIGILDNAELLQMAKVYLGL